MHTLPPAALTVLLAAIGLLNSLGSDLVIPSLPALRDDLQASDWQAQQVIALFFGACAFMSLWHGALADAWGRRRVILGALALIVVTTLGCVFSERIEQLWVLRTLQGLASGAGLVISRAIVRDLHTGLPAQRLLSHILMVQTLSFAAMPALGGWLAETWGWRGVFAVAAACTILLIGVCWRWLPETLPSRQRRLLQPRALWHTYAATAGNGRFMRLSLAHVANWVVMAMYAFAAPAITLRHLGRGVNEVYLVFLAMTLGLVGGFVLFPRLVRRHAAPAILGRAYGVIAAAVIANVLCAALVAPGLVHLLPLVLLTVGMALALPILIDRAMSAVPAHAGVAASCQTCLQFSAMALGAGLLVPLLADSLLALATGTGIIIALGALCLLFEQRSRRGTVVANT